MSGRDLLVEIGTEELPPKALLRLATAFHDGLVAGLDQAELGHGEARRYATPRRLAVRVAGVAEAQPDKRVERRGPALKAAFDPAGRPTKAATGFARSCGVEVEALERLETPKGAWLAYHSTVAGRPARELLPGIIEQALAGLPIPKRMRWGSSRVEFVRPVHWVVLLFGEEVLDSTVLGVSAGRETYGHRFHHPQALSLPDPAGYPGLLEREGRVLPDFEQRRARIRDQVRALAAELGGEAVIDPDLLDEVTALVEWPVAIAGGFEARFLDVPPEALVATMKGNQKYFHLVDDQQRLMPHFIAVANIDSRDPALVRTGNERVIRPRLADAEFFWNQDRARPLAARAAELKNVVFQQRLGTLRDKARRVTHLCEQICSRLGTDPDLGRRAAELAKCDLLTEMVGEFPGLQGIMGRYYALHDGEPEEVAEALDEQYMPRFAGDRLPAGPTGQALAIADRLDTLVGIFGIGQSPSGDRDPYGLRRAALGVLRIAIERRLELDLHELLEMAARAYDGLFAPEPVVEQVFGFMMERLRGYYLEAGVAPDTFEAVLARRPTRPLDFHQRIEAVTAFRGLPEAASLAAANKRIHNILRRAEEAIPEAVDPSLLRLPAEQALAEELHGMSQRVQPMLDLGDYRAALTSLAGLRPSIDRFFDDVMVMDEDPALRHNRLALLQRVSDLFLGTADISRLQS